MYNKKSSHFKRTVIVFVAKISSHNSKGSNFEVPKNLDFKNKVEKNMPIESEGNSRVRDRQLEEVN